MEITRSFYLWWQDGVIFEPFTYTCPSFCVYQLMTWSWCSVSFYFYWFSYYFWSSCAIWLFASLLFSVSDLWDMLIRTGCWAILYLHTQNALNCWCIKRFYFVLIKNNHVSWEVGPWTRQRATHLLFKQCYYLQLYAHFITSMFWFFAQCSCILFRARFSSLSYRYIV